MTITFTDARTARSICKSLISSKGPQTIAAMAAEVQRQIPSSSRNDAHLAVGEALLDDEFTFNKATDTFNLAR